MQHRLQLCEADGGQADEKRGSAANARLDRFCRGAGGFCSHFFLRRARQQCSVGSTALIGARRRPGLESASRQRYLAAPNAIVRLRADSFALRAAAVPCSAPWLGPLSKARLALNKASGKVKIRFYPVKAGLKILVCLSTLRNYLRRQNHGRQKPSSSPAYSRMESSWDRSTRILTPGGTCPGCPSPRRRRTHD